MKNTLFFHVPKTGGSSFVREAAKVVGDEGCENYSQSLQDKAPLISGHVPWHFLEQFIKTRYSFTILRDPVDRVWSFCRYKEDMVGGKPDGPTADTFLFDREWISTQRQLENRYVTQLGGDFYDLKDTPHPDWAGMMEQALENLTRLDGIFFLEDDHQEELFKAIDLPWDETKFHNVTPVTTPLTDERRDRCMELTEWDRRFYHEAQELYQ